MFEFLQSIDSRRQVSHSQILEDRRNRTMPKATASRLHITEALWKRVQTAGMELPVFMARPSQLQLWKANETREREVDRFVATFGEASFRLEDPLIVNLYFHSGLAVLFEGHHRTEAALKAGWAWLPVIFYLHAGSGHHSPYVQARLDISDVDNRIDITMREQFDPAKRPSYLFTSYELKRDTLAWVGIETLDPFAEYNADMFKAQPANIKPHATSADFHRQWLINSSLPTSQQDAVQADQQQTVSEDPTAENEKGSPKKLQE